MSGAAVQQPPAGRQTGSSDAKGWQASIKKAREARAQKRLDEAASESPPPRAEPTSAAAAKAAREMASASTKAALRPRTTVRMPYEPDYVPSPGKRHLVQDIPPGERVTGNRIASMDTFHQQMLPHVQCPACFQVGQLVARADDEISSGLAGTVVFFCSICDTTTLRWEQSRVLERRRVFRLP